MAKPLRPIKQFLIGDPERTDNALLIEWWGAVTTSQSDFRNPKAFLLVSEHAPINPKTLKPAPPQPDLRLSAGIASINAIEVGGIYKDGMPDDVRTEDALVRRVPEQIEFTFYNPAQLKRLMRQEKNVNAYEWVDPSRSMRGLLGNQDFPSSVKVIEGHCVQKRERRNVGRDDRERARVKCIFNELEIVRFYYTSSNHLACSVFAGDFEPDRIDELVLSDSVNKSACKNGKAELNYRQRFTNSDAVIIARIVLDPSGAARKGALRVARSLAATQSSHGTGVGFVRTLFPFKGRTTLSLTGKTVRYEGEDHFLVHRIDSCTAPFPFRRLACNRIVEDADNDSDESNELQEDGFAVVKTGPGMKSGLMDVEGKADGSSLAVESEPDFLRFLGLQCELEFKKVATRKNSTSKIKMVPDQALVDSSPGTETNGRTNAVRHVIDNTITHGDPPEDLAAFADHVRHVAERFDGTIETVPLFSDGWTHPATGDAYNVFPKVRLKKSKRYRTISYVDEHRKVERLFLCYVVTTTSTRFHVIHAQRRKIIDGSTERDRRELSVRVIRQADNMINDSDLEEFMEETVKAGKWPQTFRKHPLQRFNHTTVGTHVFDRILKRFAPGASGRLPVAGERIVTL